MNEEDSPPPAARHGVRSTLCLGTVRISHGPNVPVVRVPLPGPKNGASSTWCTNGAQRGHVFQRHGERTNWLNSPRGNSPKVFTQLQILHTRALPRHHIPNWLLGARTSPRAKVMPEDVWGDAVRVPLTRPWRHTRRRRWIGARAIKQVHPGEPSSPFAPLCVTLPRVFLSCATACCARIARKRRRWEPRSLTHVLI